MITRRLSFTSSFSKLFSAAIVLFIGLALVQPCVAQDILVLRDSSRIESQVNEVTEDEIRYHRASNPGGPIYTAKVKKVDRIEFENGTVEYFNRKNGKSGKGGSKAGNSGSGSLANRETQGQTEGKNKLFVGLDAGLMMALGDYKATTGDDVGAAQNGYSFGLEGAYYLPFFPMLGISAQGGFFTNPVDVDAVAEDISGDASPVLEGLLNAALPPELGELQPPEISTSSANWQGYYAVVGPVFSYPLGRFEFDARVRGGILSLHDPSVNAEYSLSTRISIGPFPLPPTELVNVDLESDGTTDEVFLFNGGLGVRFHLNSKLALRFNADYYTANTDYNTPVDAIVNMPDQLGTINVERAYKPHFQTLRLGLGAVYNF